MVIQGHQLPDLRTLSVDDRLLLMEAIWDSLVADGEMVGLTEAQKKELERRIDKYAGAPAPDSMTWDEVKRFWRERRK